MKSGEIWSYHDGGVSQWTKCNFSLDLWHQIIYCDDHCAVARLIATKSLDELAVMHPPSFNQTSLVIPSEFVKDRALVSAESIK